MYASFSVLIIQMFGEGSFVREMQKGGFAKVHVLNVSNLFLLIYQNILQLRTTAKLKEKTSIAIKHNISFVIIVLVF